MAKCKDVTPKVDQTFQIEVSAEERRILISALVTTVNDLHEGQRSFNTPRWQYVQLLQDIRGV